MVAWLGYSDVLSDRGDEMGAGAVVIVTALVGDAPSFLAERTDGPWVIRGVTMKAAVVCRSIFVSGRIAERWGELRVGIAREEVSVMGLILFFAADRPPRSQRGCYGTRGRLYQRRDYFPYLSEIQGGDLVCHIHVLSRGSYHSYHERDGYLYSWSCVNERASTLRGRRRFRLRCLQGGTLWSDS